MPIYSGNCPIVAKAVPVSVAAAGTQVTGWFDARVAPRFRTIVVCGAGAGTPAITWQQGNTSAGGGAKSLSWNAGTYSSSVIDTESHSDTLDQNGGFFWVQGTITITGGTGTITGTTVLAEDNQNGA